MSCSLSCIQVDALCVDQSPTPQQAQQLAMMDIIYQCSAVTIVALSGENSAAGLPGVSRESPRIPQGREVIDGNELLTIFPLLAQDLESVTHSTRAWTMQEVMMTRCRIIFTNHQVRWWCNSAEWSECVDETCDPANYTVCADPDKALERSWFNTVSA